MTRSKIWRVLMIGAVLVAGGAGSAAAQTVKNPAPKEARAPAQSKTCPDGRTIPANQACPPPPPLTSRCPGKIVVPYQALCPAANAPLPPQPDAAKPLSPKGNPGNWVPQSAYPRDALRDNIEGMVGFTLVVGPDGRPTQCRISSSSGNDSLDWGACESLMRRARFNPAIDADGKPVVGTYTNRVRWAISKSDGGTYDGSERAPFAERMFGDFTRRGVPMSAGVTVVQIFGADGVSESCNVSAKLSEDGRDLPVPDNAEATLCAKSIKPLPDANGNPARTRLEFTFVVKSEIAPE